MRTLSCLLLLLSALSASCTTTRTCKDQTVLVTVALNGATAQADQLDVTVEITGGATLQATGLPHTAGSATGTLQIEFPRGYPANQRIRVVLSALIGNDIVGVGESSITLTETCTAIPLNVDPLATADLSTPDLMSPNRYDLGSSARYDLTLPAVDLAGLACGVAGQYCCDGEVCQNSRCTNGICQSDCGGPGQPCCQGTSCAKNFFCNPGAVCVLCGVPGEACCAPNDCGSGCCENGRCVGTGETCSNGMACSNGACGNCGTVGTTCCPNRQCTAAGTRCFGVDAGMCSACGASGQNCCAGNTCSAGNVCAGGLCGACNPGNCASLGSDCGPTPRACGTPIECGLCTIPMTCNFANGTGHCQ